MITDPKPEGYKLPECIYDEDLSAQSSLAITNLDGDHDYKYLIEIEGAIPITAGPTITTNLNAAWQGDGFYFKDDAGFFIIDGDISGQPKLGDGFIAGGAVNQVSIQAELLAVKGIERKFRSDCSLRNATYKARTFLSAHHTTDTTTNVTSITLNFGGNFTGNVTIYRVLKK